MRLRTLPRWWLLSVALSVIVVAQVGVTPSNNVSLKQTSDRKFRVGDVWEYHTRPGEEGSRLTIVRIDRSADLGIIVHVAVDRIRLKNCHDGPEPDAVSHMPFARQALEASITKKVASKQPLPAFENGYEEWRAAYMERHAGIYTITVAEAVDVAEFTFRKGIGCEPTGDHRRQY